MSQKVDSLCRFSRVTLYCLFAVTVFLSSCTKDDKYDYRVLEPEETEKAYKIMVVSGNRQTGAVGSQLPDSLVVYVSDENKLALPAWKVDFKVIRKKSKVQIPPKEVYRFLDAIVYDGGVGLYNSFNHVDRRGERARWTG